MHFKTISDLSSVHGGNRVTLLEDLVKRIGGADLSKKQLGKLDKQLSGFEKKNGVAKDVFGPEELPPLGASDAEAWKFYGGK
jgi:hypothetical protein